MRRLILALVMLLPLAAFAVDVRGRIDYRVPGGVVPMNQAFVELCFAPTNACLQYRTGYDGMYYFSAEPGPHYIRVNGIVRFNLVIPAVPNFDITPLFGN